MFDFSSRGLLIYRSYPITMGRKRNPKSSTPGDRPKKMSSVTKKELNDLVEQLLQKCTTLSAVSVNDWPEYLEIYDLVEKITKLEEDFNFPLLKREAHIQDFMKWLKAEGIKIDDINIEKFEEGDYGLKALKDFKADELVLTVPRKIMMTTETAKLSKLGCFMLQDPILQNMPNVVLAMHLLCERCIPASFWTSYINILPDNFTTSLYFSPTQLQLLKGSPTLEESIKQFRNIARQYAYFFKQLENNPEARKLPLHRNFTFNNYRWAVSAVMTRQNSIPSLDRQQVINALIPLWDMCNHCEGYITTDFNSEKDSVECYAVKHFKKGEQICIFYGPRSNAELFNHNGFVYPENNHDWISIKLGLSKNDTLFSLKMELLSKLNIPGSGYFKLLQSKQPLDQSMLAFLRVFHMSQDELKQWLAVDCADSLMDVNSPCCRVLDVQICSFLKTRIILLLKAYPTTVVEDEMSLAGNLPQDDILLIQLCLTEKQIFISVMEILEEGKLFIA